MSDSLEQRLRVLGEATLALARSAPSGRLALARLAEAIDPLWLAEPGAEELVSELAKADEAASEPVAYRAIERSLRDAWGTAPSRELDELEREPVSVTPIAQVHRGALDGEPVAVKVLRPAIDARVRQDLVLLDALARPLGAALPGLDAAQIIAEVRERVLEELDLESEGDAQRRVHRALRDHPTLHVPAPVSRLGHHSVLVTPWVEGTPLRAASEGPERNRAAALYAAFVIGSAHFGLAHSAPTRGDVRLLGDGRVAVLDFGAVAETDGTRVTLAADALDALHDDDGPGFGRALGRLGVLPETEGERALALARHALGPLGGPGPVALDVDAVLAARDRLGERLGDLARLAVAVTPVATDLWPLRGAGQVFAAIARSGGATADWLALTRSALRDGFDTARDIERFL